MNNYYFLTSILPSVAVGLPVELSIEGLLHLFNENLSRPDLDQVNTIRRLYDILNIRLFWRDEPLDPLGLLEEKELEEAIATGLGFPGYINDFLNRYESVEDRLRYFPGLVAAYFEEEIPKAEGFLQELLTFEKEWRLVFLAFRAKKMDRDVTVELQYEDPFHEVVAQVLAQKDAKTFEPPTRYEELKPIFENYGDSPLELHQAVCEYRFERVEQLCEGQIFTMDKVLGYFAQFIIAIKWQELEQQKGSEIVETILKGAS